MLCLRQGRGIAPAVQRTGTVLALLVLAVSALLILDWAIDPIGPLWQGTGSWRFPQGAHLIAVVLLGLGLATIDRDPPRFLWSGLLVPLCSFAVLATLVINGYEVGNLVDSDADIGKSVIASAVLVALLGGFVFLRCERGLARLLLEHGPGPAATRLMVPTAVLLVALVGLVEHVTDSLGAEGSDLSNGSTQMTILFVLLAVTYVLSRLLQRYYQQSQIADADLRDRAAILENLLEGVGVVSLETRKLVYNNRRLEVLLGYGPGEMLALDLDALIPDDESPEEAALRRASRQRVIEEGSTVDTLRSVRKDGSEIWGRSTATRTESLRFGPVVVWSFGDVTEEHRRRQEKAEADKLFRELFDRSPVGLSLVRSDHTFASVNPAFCEITGYSEAELLTMTFDEITHPDDLERDRELSGQMFGGRTAGFELEKRYLRKDGSVVWVKLTSAPLADGSPDNGLALSIVEDVTDSRKLHEELTYLADHDELTGLLNRRRLGMELERVAGDRSESGVAVLLLDLDNFKFINDRFGHHVGDRLIVETADVLARRLRGHDTLARQGGDEFVVVLADVAPEDAVRLGEEFVDLIAKEVMIEAVGIFARLTVSVGVAHSVRGDDLSAETLLQRADIALYEAKDEGRNTVKLYDPDESTSMQRGVDWTASINSAIEDGSFVAFGQPVLGLDYDGDQIYELFVRMETADGILHGPDSFLPIAERHDLIQGIDRWMVGRALELLTEHEERGIRARLAVNLSAKSIGDSRFLRAVTTQISNAGIDTSLLIFEITETSAMRNVDDSCAFAESLSELGCGFALDDFGSGFASFRHLDTIDYDFVKIDGEFVRSMNREESSRILVKAMIEMTRALDKCTIAEMVEDIETLDLLAGLGVDCAQGYLIGRPRDVSEIDFGAPVEFPARPGPRG
jgi:diguanylate cyclase (GGDEF)-like protein/PAS domain S-box-containing protein